MAPLMALSEAAKQQTPLNPDGKDGDGTAEDDGETEEETETENEEN